MDFFENTVLKNIGSEGDEGRVFALKESSHIDWWWRLLTEGVESASQVEPERACNDAYKKCYAVDHRHNLGLVLVSVGWLPSLTCEE